MITRTFSLSDFATLAPGDTVDEDGHVRKRVICVDYEACEILCVTDDAYAARDFSKPERVPFAEALAL